MATHENGPPQARQAASDDGFSSRNFAEVAPRPKNLKSPARCPLCGARSREVRFGIEFSPLKARIIDLVARSGADGIHADHLHDIMQRSCASLKSHIAQINNVSQERTADCDAAAGNRHYRLVRDSNSAKAE